MLDQIQHSKDELARANDELEERVARRMEQSGKTRDAAEAVKSGEERIRADR